MGRGRTLQARKFSVTFDGESPRRCTAWIRGGQPPTVAGILIIRLGRSTTHHRGAGGIGDGFGRLPRASRGPPRATPASPARRSARRTGEPQRRTAHGRFVRGDHPGCFVQRHGVGSSVWSASGRRRRPRRRKRTWRKNRRGWSHSRTTCRVVDSVGQVAGAQPVTAECHQPPRTNSGSGIVPRTSPTDTVCFPIPELRRAWNHRIPRP